MLGSFLSDGSEAISYDYESNSGSYYDILGLRYDVLYALSF